MTEAQKPRYSWTQPICERCFEERSPGRVPSRLQEHVREDEVCVVCGVTNRDGIYTRIDPTLAKFPTYTKDEG